MLDFGLKRDLSRALTGVQYASYCACEMLLYLSFLYRLAHLHVSVHYAHTYRSRMGTNLQLKVRGGANILYKVHDVLHAPVPT